MSLQSIVADIAADLAAHNVTVPVAIGKDLPAQEGNPLTGRIVVIPRGFEHGPTKNRVGGNPRVAAVRVQTIEIHVWGRAADQGDPVTQYAADYDFASSIGDALVMSLWRQTAGSLTLGSGAPNDDAITVAFGVELVFTAKLMVPILDQAWPTADGVVAARTDKMTFPAGNHVAQPDA